MKKTKYLSIIIAAAMLACIAPAALGADDIAVERSFNDNVAAGGTFEVMLSIDVSEENKPTMYILTENVPAGFEVVDTDAKVNDNATGKMKWVAIDGLFGGKVEDIVYVYHLRAPDTVGEYNISGNVLLKDESRHETAGRTMINVAEAGSISNSTGILTILPYAVIILIIISAAVLYSGKKTAKVQKAGHVKK